MFVSEMREIYQIASAIWPFSYFLVGKDVPPAYNPSAYNV